MSADSLRQLVDTLLNGSSRYAVSHHITDWLAAGIVLGAAMAELLTLYAILFGIFMFFENIDSLFRAFVGRLGAGEKNVPQAFLELVFPAATPKSAFATEQLHVLLRGVVKYYGFWDNLAARKKPYSLEIVGTNDEGIRYMLMIPASEVDGVQVSSPNPPVPRCR